MFQCVTIIGVGLIGGSLALEIKKKKLAKKVIGCGRSLKNLQIAKKRRLIDSATTQLEDSISHSDFIILSAPVQTIAHQLKIIAKKARPGTLVMDVGSTKEQIVNQAQKILPSSVFFIGAHPLAGTEKSGAAAALPNLFKNRLCLLTPTPRTSQKALKKIKIFWKKMGAKTLIYSPKKHDQLLAFTSHLPQVVASLLITTLSKNLPSSQIQKLSGGGLRDTTRIAASDSFMWLDILDQNKKNILLALKNFEKEFKKIVSMIQKRDLKNLQLFLNKASLLRKKLV